MELVLSDLSIVGEFWLEAPFADDNIGGLERVFSVSLPKVYFLKDRVAFLLSELDKWLCTPREILVDLVDPRRAYQRLSLSLVSRTCRRERCAAPGRSSRRAGGGAAAAAAALSRPPASARGSARRRRRRPDREGASRRRASRGGPGRVLGVVPAVARERGEVDPADERDLVVDDHELLVMAVHRALARVEHASDRACRPSARRGSA